MDTASALGKGIEGTARWSLRLFGGFELSALPGGERVTLSVKRERVLLAYLALSPNGRQQRRKLTTLLWGDASDETTLDNLRNCLWGLRKALGDSEHRMIASEGEDIVLDAAAFEVDALAFRRLAAQSGRTELEAAANHCAGEFLDGLDIDSEEFESWRRAEGARCRDQTVDVLSRLMAQLSDAGETERAIETGLRLLRLEPLHEPTLRRLMRLYGESGRRGVAIQLYRTLADALKTELGVQPEAETRAIFAEIARGGEETLTPTPAEAKPLPPTRIASPSAGPQSPPPPMPEPAQEGPAIGAAQKVVPPQARNPLGWIVAGGLAAAIALFLLYQFAGPVAQPTGIEAAKTASSSPAGTVAIAVLPFVNLSSDPEQEFFSDGMTEEITSALAKVPDLRVVARTSAYQFKAQNRDIQSIGQQLHATHFIEGSVRKAGDRVRITAQLIKADDGTHVWSEDYDRQLTDIFAVQEDIARAITTSLRAPLGLKPGENLVNNRSIDPESYEQFLRARAFFLRGGQMRNAEATALLEQVVASNPDYVPAWRELARAYYNAALLHPARFSGSPDEFRRAAEANLAKGEAAARRAIQLDANRPEGYVALAQVLLARGNIPAADEMISKAFALDANDPFALSLRSANLAIAGQVKEANAMMQQLRTLEPFVPVYNRFAALYLWVDGQNDAAIAILKDLPAANNANNPADRAMIYASMGRYGEAADLLENLPALNGFEAFSKDAARLLRTAPLKVAGEQSLPQLGQLGWVYLYIGAPQRALEYNEREAEAGFRGFGFLPMVWHPSWAPVRKTERFKTYVRGLGLVEYWRAKGWPQWCHPTTGDDFECV
jgi:TolB-like protein/DNA-binding SARP family transcriptional activator/Flp pilus assembly protein TadD